ncbi:MAG: phenylalanine--tRNA ligase subunit alpha [Thermodesulfobacteriota bacterium]
MSDRLATLEAEALKELSAAGDKDAVIGIRIHYLGKKGVVTAITRELPTLPQDERPAFGREINAVKGRLEARIVALLDGFSRSERAERLKRDRLDITMPGRRTPLGKRHPITQVLEEVEEIFLGLGFETAEGPELESDYYNFEALNLPPDHPARDMQDTFYINDDLLLRTHTSPVQIRYMEKREPPLRVIAPGKVYRRDSDLSHTPMFHQVEGFMVDENITFGDLKGTLTAFLKKIFSEDIATRFRPSFFPFTEPSAEVDIGCLICGGGGCRVCKGSGWLEILGAGMIHPEVFRAVGYDHTQYSGFAFGVGIERIAMLKLGVDDIRLFFENDLRFLAQF